MSKTVSPMFAVDLVRHEDGRQEFLVKIEVGNYEFAEVCCSIVCALMTFCQQGNIEREVATRYLLSAFAAYQMMPNLAVEELPSRLN